MQPSTHFKTYKAAAGANQVIATGKSILHRILIGADVASGDLTIGDDPAASATATCLKFSSSTLMTSTGGVIHVGAVFNNGICVTSTNQTQVTYIWEPIN